MGVDDGAHSDIYQEKEPAKNSKQRNGSSVVIIVMSVSFTKTTLIQTEAQKHTIASLSN